MTPIDTTAWAADFEAFHARFAGYFARREPREQVVKYVHGLLSSVQRKNSWQIAEAVGDSDPQPTQRLLYSATWDADAVRDELQHYVVEQFGDANGIGVLDETGFLKKGTKSVGVKRQYSGTAGKVENCQIGVLLSYVSPYGHTFLDRRLYLPTEWCQDRARRDDAKVPQEVVFQTKPQLGGAMLRHAWTQGVPMRWVTGDEVYGNAPDLRALIATQDGVHYVLAVAAKCPVWAERPSVAAPTPHTGDRPHAKGRLAPDAPGASTVSAIVAAWPEAQWQRLTVAAGEKGLRTYDWAQGRVVESQRGLPGPTCWLLARRSIGDPTDIAYYLSDASGDTPLRTLACVAAARWTVEQCIEESKGEVGLDEYEVRYWQSWHRHITCAMLAHAWLAHVRSRAWGEKGRPRAGRTDGPRSEAVVGHRHAAPSPIHGAPSELVALATRQAVAGAP
jgi:SRSO17 transposase